MLRGGSYVLSNFSQFVTVSEFQPMRTFQTHSTKDKKKELGHFLFYLIVLGRPQLRNWEASTMMMKL
jgi:hypothetical protein